MLWCHNNIRYQNVKKKKKKKKEKNVRKYNRVHGEIYAVKKQRNKR